MQRKKYDGSELRQVLIGMVVDKSACSRISSQWTKDGLFDTEWANLVGSWCVKHLQKYGDPPNGKIKSIFETWAEDTIASDEIITGVERFLQSLSDEYNPDEFPSGEFILDLSEKYFNRVITEKEIQKAKLELDRGRVGDAQNRLNSLRRVDLGLADFVEPAANFELWRDAFKTERVRPLVRYPGAVGEYFKDAFCKGQLYSFMGPDKTGKTAVLLDFAYRGIRSRNRVAFFDTGDSSQEEIIARLACRAGHAPEYPGEYEIPVKWQGDDLITETRTYDPINLVQAFQKFKKVCKSDNALRISCHPNSTINVAGIKNILMDWEKENWIPDIVVIDYADILAPPTGVTDQLEQIDQTWKQMRKLSQERNRPLVMTATQSNAAAYGKEKGLLGPQHFSGRKTKMAHVNGMIGINVSSDERLLHMSRWNWVRLRKMRNPSRSRKFVTIAGQFDMENPIIISK